MIPKTLKRQLMGVTCFLIAITLLEKFGLNLDLEIFKISLKNIFVILLFIIGFNLLYDKGLI